jgi:L-fuculose-phosphate aldolase
LPESVAPFCKDYNAILLGNHGALAWGRNLTEAWYRMEALEHYAVIIMNTSFVINKAKTLTKDQVAALIAIRERLGVKTGGIPS